MSEPSFNVLDIRVNRLSSQFDDLPLPAHSTSGSAGMDLCAAIDQAVTINPGSWQLIPTSLAFEIPIGYECQVRSRSGLAAKNGIFCLNSPGTIDSDYRGEVKVILANFGVEPYVVQRGDRIAQLVVARHERVHCVLTEELGSTKRADGGFGSTGVSSTTTG